ncbi:DUF559 domain-containing protein [Methylobacterium terricola]|uniref:DUF559 domain-containing protein n=1 Tax=Methylobacterium terricola TaxID=2583531 RepID=A0A5C4LIT5_9HYPH|nr:DUF559 domain-containing protein [Methylobacterium terricola]TNC14131.1 DUF559 domain-containing protein [Methylobacterium terricola]
MRGPDDPGTARARTLRRTQTDSERALWSRLPDRRLAEAKFVRQRSIGRDFADFACREAKLVVERDGSQHAESGYDREREAWLASQGWRVLGFWSGDVARNMTGVLETILASIVERRPSSSPHVRQGCSGKERARVSPLPAGGERGNPHLFLSPDSPAAGGEGHPASSRTEP